MVDLTKVDVPFGELSRELKLALMAAWVDGQKMESATLVNSEWALCATPSWFSNCRYRVRPAPLTPDSIDWSHVAPEWRFMARDRGGLAWLYSNEPRPEENSWRFGRDLTKADAFASYRIGTCDWKDSLVVRP